MIVLFINRLLIWSYKLDEYINLKIEQRKMNTLILKIIEIMDALDKICKINNI